LLHKLRSPVFLLTLSNLGSAVIGFFSGMLTARWLGAGAYGVMGVISAINATVLNFVDLRLNDVMAKLYYDKEGATGTELARRRASLIQSSLICYGALAVAFFAIGILANAFLPRFFTSVPVRSNWILASAAGTSITYFVNPIGYMQRLTGRFRLLAAQALIGSVISSGLMVLCVWLHKDLDGYYLGFLISNLVGACLAVGIALYDWIKLDHLPLLRGLDLSALARFRKHSGFLFWGNLLGYVKLGHRSADILLVGYFCDDRVTGLYKFARTLTDKFYMLFDAMNQVYFPTFMQMLGQGSVASYRRLAGRIFVTVLLFTAATLALEAVGLPYFSQWVLKGKFAGVEPIIETLTIPFFFVTGMYIWMWPIVLHHGWAGRYTLYNAIALCIQYGVGIAGFRIFSGLLPFTLGYVGNYVVLMGLTFGMIYHRFPEAIPLLERKKQRPDDRPNT
jgi:O-antigen/teichoic acid export membrane protein